MDFYIRWEFEWVMGYIPQLMMISNKHINEKKNYSPVLLFNNKYNKEETNKKKLNFKYNAVRISQLK